MDSPHALSMKPIDEAYLLCFWVTLDRFVIGWTSQQFILLLMSAYGFHVHLDVNQWPQEVSLAIFTD